MNASIREPADVERQSVVLERTFAARRELLFRLFTEPEHLMRWWCPYPLTFAVCEFDARPGGSFRQVMETSDGTRFPYLGEVVEVDPPNRVVFSSREDIADPDLPRTEVLNTITFAERGEHTLVRVRIDVLQACPTTSQTLRGMEIGWMQDFGRLDFYLLDWILTDPSRPTGVDVETTPSDREIVSVRTFDAPRSLIFSTMTDPALIPRWWGETTTVERMDFRPGGSWRFVQHVSDGDSQVLGGEYFHINPPELIVNSFEIGVRHEPTPFDQLRIDAVHLYDLGDQTHVTRISLFPSNAERDGALRTGLVGDTVESYERLERVLLSLV